MRKDWLSRQFARVDDDVRNWPESMKVEAGYSMIGEREGRVVTYYRFDCGQLERITQAEYQFAMNRGVLLRYHEEMLTAMHGFTYDHRGYVALVLEV